MLSAPAMSETDRMPAQAAFIWYHADAALTEELQAWVNHIGRTQKIRGRLMIREQRDKTTFMEIYEPGAGDIEPTLAAIEADAARQPWFNQLQSPRRTEVFSEIDPF